MVGDPLDERVRKLSKLIGLGINPYPHVYRPTHRVDDLVREKEVGVSVNVAGRLTGLRDMGKAIFADIVDRQAKIQLLLTQDQLGEVYGLVSLLDIGDTIGIEGVTFNTRTGEYSIRANQLKILAKSLRPSVAKSGVRDSELRYTDRTLDLLANPKVIGIFVKRSKIISAMRRYLDDHGFTEVEVPLIQPVYGGAAAAPFITHVNALDRDYFLSISPELYLKRLIAGGFDAVYAITKNFRNEGISPKHNPEFTSMECYRAYDDYNGMMGLTEEMTAAISLQVNGSTTVTYLSATFKLEPPWERLPYMDAVEKYSGLKVGKMHEGQLKDWLRRREENKPTTECPSVIYQQIDNMTRDQVIIGLFEEFAEPHLTGPVFVVDYPAESTPLCKPHRDRRGLIERFEAYIAGMEIANAYSELNDPMLQRRLLEEQVKRERARDNPYPDVDKPFLRALEYGMPPTGGLGIGVDRLVMVLTGKSSIKDVILFPFTKSELK